MSSERLSDDYTSATIFQLWRLVIKTRSHLIKQADFIFTILNMTFSIDLFPGFLAQTVFLMSAAFLMTPFGTISCIIIAIGLGAFAWCGFS